MPSSSHDQEVRIPEEVTLAAGRTVEECDGARGDEPTRSITAEYDPSCRLVQFVQYGEEVFGTLEPVEPEEWAEFAARLHYGPTQGPSRIREAVLEELKEKLLGDDVIRAASEASVHWRPEDGEIESVDFPKAFRTALDAALKGADRE